MRITVTALKRILLLSVVTAFLLPQAGVAKSYKEHKVLGKNGPCMKVKCRGLEGDALQNCMAEKRTCMQAHFDEKLENAEKKGITAEKKEKWVARLEHRANKREERGASAEELAPLKEKIERVKALKESKK